jgi:hypothetical protein
MSFLLEMGMFFAVQSLIDFNDPTVLTLVRAAYVGVALLFYFTAGRVPPLIDEFYEASPEARRQGERFVWVPTAKAKPGLMDSIFGSKDGAGGGAAPALPASAYRRTTLRQHEIETSKAFVESLIGARVPPLVFSVFMNIHIMLALQLFRMPMEAVRLPLFRKYILGHDLGDRPQIAGGEVYDDPAASSSSDGDEASRERVEDGGDGNGNGAAPAVEGGGLVPPRVDGELEDAIFRTWEAAIDPAPVGWFEERCGPAAGGGRRSINYATAKDGWTALMVVCGGSQNGRAEVRKMLELGARPEVADREGWTAVHWAAFHDNAAAIAAVAEAYGPLPAAGSARAGAAVRCGDEAALRALLGKRDAKGRTASRVAEEEGAKAAGAAAALEAAAQRVGLDARALAESRDKEDEGEEEEEEEEEEGEEEKEESE